MEYVNKKQLNNISLNKNNFYVLIDFDRTLTAGDSHSIWRILYYSNLLGDSFQKKYNKIHYKFSIIKTDEEKQIKNYENRFKEYFKLFKECKLSEQIIKEAVKKTDIKMRKGAANFLKKMNSNDIPVIIISCGLKNIILEYLKFNKSYYNNIYIYSNYIDLDGQDKNNIYNITPYNKNKIGFSDEVINQIKDKEKILLIGDILDDINMVTKKDLKNTIKVGFLDKDIKKHLAKYKNSFDIVLTANSSFENLENILKL